MSQIGLKALKVLGGVERPTDSTAQLSEAWLNKIKKINQVADNMDTNNGVVKKKPTSNKKPQTQAAPMMEQKERQVPITEILARTKTEKIGLNKAPVSTDDIKALLTGQKSQAKIPVVENRRLETQYEEFIKESKSYQTDNIIDEQYQKPQMMNKNVDIRQMVNEEVTRILFKEVFSKDRLKVMMESVFRDVIKEKAKEILFETLKRRKSEGY
jgi:hypothetical protein